MHMSSKYSVADALVLGNWQSLLQESDDAMQEDDVAGYKHFDLVGSLNLSGDAG